MNSKEIKQLSSDYMQIWNVGKVNFINEFADDNLEVDYTHFEKLITAYLNTKRC